MSLVGGRWAKARCCERTRLNKRTIDEATYHGPGGCYLWDTQLTAFGVRI